MDALKRYAKFVAALVAPVWAVAQSAVSDGQIDSNEWGLIAGAAVAAALVLAVPNKPSTPDL